MHLGDRVEVKLQERSGIQEPGVHGKGSHVCMFQERWGRYWGTHGHMCGYVRDGEFPRVLNFGEGVQPVAGD